MSIRNLKDGSKKPWLCECYPHGRTGKRIRKRFATKGEAVSFEQFTMREVNELSGKGLCLGQMNSTNSACTSMYL